MGKPVATLSTIASFVKTKRKEVGLTQQQLADLSGVSIWVIRNLEQNIGTQRVATVNRILALFGHELGAQPKPRN